MALIKTIAEIKAVLPRLVSNLSDTSLLPNFDRAEEKYLVPITGRDLYGDIKTKYNATTLTSDEQTLLKQMQLVIAAYALHDELAFTHSKITDTGVRRNSTAQQPAAYNWEYQELKNGLKDAAIDGVEVLLTTLVAQAPALWIAAAEYTEFKRLLIKTGLEFDGIEKLQQPLRTYWMIKTVVADVQQNYISNTIGPDLLEYLRDKVAPTDEEKSILKLLKKALANYTIKHAMARYAVRFDSNGLTVITGDSNNTETSGRAFNTALVDVKMKEHETNASGYLARAAYECYQFNAGAASDQFKTAYAAGPLESYAAPADRDNKNATRKIFRF
jgi:hypothetical protein